MSNKMVTLAIHTPEKANYLKQLLAKNGIGVEFENVETNDSKGSTTCIRIRIKEEDLPVALNLVEDLLNEKVEPSDDGRHRILVPVDFSDYSMKACKVAFHLAEKLGAKVKIMHVYFNPFSPTALPIAEIFTQQVRKKEEYTTIVDRVRSDIKRLCQDIDAKIATGELPTVNYSYILREGLAEEEIIDFSQEYKPSLIVVGTRGKNRKDADLIGSVAAEVLEAAHASVIALPENIHFDRLSEVQNLAFFTNFTQRDLIAFDQFASMVKANNSTVFLTHIANKRDTWDEIKLEGVLSYLKKTYPHINIDYGILNGNELNEDIERYIRAKKIDILVIPSSRRNVFARMFNPSIARKMLFHTDTPVMVLRGK